jgi:hypothetical protein
MSRVETKYVATPASLADGQFAVALCDANGRMQVAEQFAPQAEDNENGVIQTVIKPIASSTYAPSLHTNLGTASGAKANAKAAAGNVLSIYAHNTDTGKRYIQIHNTATTPTTGVGATPVLTFAVPADSAVTIGRDMLSQAGIHLSTGIAVAMSTDQHQFTAATDNKSFWHVTYI